MQAIDLDEYSNQFGAIEPFDTNVDANAGSKLALIFAQG